MKTNLLQILRKKTLILGVFLASCCTLLNTYSNSSNFFFFEKFFQPNATISTNDDNICVNETTTITLTGLDGVAPYDFTYQINNITQPVINSEGDNEAVITFDGNNAGNFTIKLIEVKDAAGLTKEVLDQEITITVNTPPTVDFTFNNNNACAGETIQFTTTESGNGDFTYLWDFEDGNTSTSKDPTHVFNTAVGCSFRDFDVQLTITDRNGCSTTITKQIQVKEKPDINFSDAAFGNFNNCGNSSVSDFSYTITVNNNSNSSSCIDSYTINWGDGSSESPATFPATHTYTQNGVFDMKIKAIGNDGCENEVSYEVKNVSNPAGGFQSPGNTSNLCPIDSELTFTITNFESNSSDTLYFVNFGDGSPTASFTQIEIENQNTITHKYEEGSCSFPNGEFIATLSVQNACATTQFTINNITVLDESGANFSFPESNCVDSDILFTNNSKIGANLNCSKGANLQWDFGDGTIINDNNANKSNNQTHRYTNPGTYTVKLSVSSRCGTDIFTDEICIDPEVTAQFTVDNSEGCIPFNVATTNTTDEAGLCSSPEYLWTVNYVADNCGTSLDWEYTNGTDETSENPEFIFNNPGKYTLTQTVITSCGSETSSRVIDVKKPPTATINPIEDSCGTATINPIAIVENCSSNSGNITYNWTFSGGTPSNANTLDPGNIVFSNPGIHEIRLEVTNECGVSNTAIQTFEVFEKPEITNTDTTQEICSGQNTTEIIFNTANTSTTYTWSAVSTGNITGFTANGTTNSIPSERLINSSNNTETLTYTVTPKIGSCEGEPFDFTITIKASPSITTQPTSSEVCINGSATILEVNYTNGLGTPAYQWFSNTNNTTSGGTAITGAINPTFNPPTDTVGNTFYYATISFNAGGCSEIISEVASVNVVEQITINPVAPPQTICVGGTANQFEVTFSNGAGTPSYRWFFNTSNNNTGGTLILGANENTYTPPAFSTNGSFFYYAEIALSGNGCSTTYSNVFEVNVVPDPVVDTQPIAAQELCANATPTDLSVAASGGTTAALNYQWFSNTNNTNTGGNPINGANSSSFTPPTNTVGTFYYYVLISQNDSGCQVTSETSTLIINDAPIFTTQPTSSEICINGVANILEVNYTNGFGTPTFQWFSNTSNSTLGGTAITGATNPTYNPPTHTVGETYYYATISFNTGGCSEIVSQIASVNVAEQIAINPVASPQTICVGGTANQFEVTFSNGAGTPSYRWFSNTSNNNTGGSLIIGANESTYTPPIFSTNGNFFYYAEISLSGNGCSTAFSDVFEVNVIPPPVIDTQPIASQKLCINAAPTDLMVAASGGTSAPLNYQWFSNTNNTNTGGNPIIGANASSFTPTSNTVGSFYYYVVISQNDSGCQVTSETSSLIINDAPVVATQPNSSEVCINESVNVLEVDYLNGLGTPTYQWFSNTSNSNLGGTAIAGATNPTYNPPTDTVGETFYYATIAFSSGGCSEITSEVASIKVNEIPNISNHEITIYSETTFNFEPSSIPNNTVPLNTQYTWSAPTFNPTNGILGASAQINPENTISQTLENTGILPIVVTYIITPATTKCTGNPFVLEVTVNPNINSNVVVNNISCFDANDGAIATNIEGGVPFLNGNTYLVSWSGPNGFSSTDLSISNLEAGLYTLRIEDSTGFFITEEWTITQPDLLSISRDNIQNISCSKENDGTIEITISGGTEPYTYNWSTTNGSGIIDGVKNQNTLAAGTYTLEIIDKNNCTTSDTFTLTEPDVLDIETLSKQDILCFGNATGEISINVTGGTQIEVSPGVFDYNYAWSGPQNFTSSLKNITNVIAGTYTVIVTDNLGCSITSQIVINEPPEVIINFTKTNVSCYGKNDGTIDVFVTGGVAPYQISWDNFANGFSQSNLSSGTYTATITDSNSCTKQVVIDIDQPSFFIDPQVKPISCNNANDGAINLNLSGGINPITVTWNDDPSAGVQRNNLSAGTYTVTIIDSNPEQCPIEETFTFTNPPAIAVSSLVTDATNCSIENSGSIDLTTSGGTAPFDFSWSNGATTEDLENISEGDYSVTITDANGCTVHKKYSIFRQAPIEIELIESFITDCDTKTTTKKIEAKTSGGFLPHSLSWSSGSVSAENNNIMITDQIGAYTLTVTDNSGCEKTTSFLIDKIPTIGTLEFNYNAFTLENYNYLSIEDPIQFTNLSSGDYTKVTWDFGDDSLPVQEENPVHTYDTVGNYKVILTVEYESGCIFTLERFIDITVGYKLLNPTAFTPNGDGYNDTIRPNFAGFSEIEMSIYNTWGTLIYFEKGTTLKGWNGTTKDKPVENGNYIMVVKGITFYNKSITTSTPITLLK